MIGEDHILKALVSATYLRYSNYVRKIVNCEIHIAFIGIQKVNDSVRLWEVLHRTKCNTYLITIIQELYNQKVAIAKQNTLITYPKGNKSYKSNKEAATRL